MAKKKQRKKRVVRRKQPQSIVSDELFIPNHSGMLDAGKVHRTPTDNLDPVNKKYVDNSVGAHTLQDAYDAGNAILTSAVQGDVEVSLIPTGGHGAIPPTEFVVKKSGGGDLISFDGDGVGSANFELDDTSFIIDVKTSVGSGSEFDIKLAGTSVLRIDEAIGSGSLKSSSWWPFADNTHDLGGQIGPVHRAWKDLYLKGKITDTTNTITMGSPITVNTGMDIGDGGTTNYTEIKADGEINLHGTARVKKKIYIGANGIKAPGAKPATFVEDGLTGCWEFADAIEANQQSISGTFLIPPDMDISIAPTLNIGWHANGISPGNCKWQLEYLWISPNEDVTAAAQETLTIVSTASATSDGLIVAEIPGIDLPSSTDKSFFWKVTRLSGDVQDTIAAVTHMRGQFMEYTANKLGEAT